jgi:hypothetical protein
MARECERTDCVIVGDADGVTIAARQCFGLILPSPSIPGRQTSAGGDGRFAGGKGPGLHSCHDALAFGEDGGSAGAVNRPVDASATEQRGVGGVSDRFGCLLGDVGGPWNSSVLRRGGGCDATSISTGAFGYPVDEAAGIAVRTMAEVLPSCAHVELVRFVLFDTDTCKALRPRRRIFIPAVASDFHYL